MTHHGLRCWDCVNHKRRLVKTEFNRPLYFTSICLMNLDVRIDRCEHFIAAMTEEFNDELKL
jgi:hypothetical protein